MNEELEALRVELGGRLESERKKLMRRRDAIRSDLARVAQAEELARLAALAVPHAASIRRGTRSVRVTDYSTGDAIEHEVPLDATRPPRESLDRIFYAAKRLRRGEPIANERLARTEQALESLNAAAAALALATDADGVRQAVDAVLGARRAPSAKTVQEAKPPYRLFRTAHGEVWVGRGAAKNDELTFRVAKPYHLWLHVRGSPGAHVVVPVARGKVASSELLVDAAHLAVRFSDLRGESIVEVSYVPRKFVRKPRGAAPGLVTMEREKVLALRVDDARTEHLLATEVT